MKTSVTPASISIFLDLDGVTHSEPCENIHQFFKKLPLISEVLKLYSVEVIISSSWRSVYTLDEIKDQFLPEIAHLIVGATPNLKRPDATWTPPTSGAERQSEIQKWLNENREWSQPWVAIDDRANWFEPNCRHLLVTDRTTGFTDDDAITLKRMIEERI